MRGVHLRLRAQPGPGPPCDALLHLGCVGSICKYDGLCTCACGRVGCRGVMVPAWEREGRASATFQCFSRHRTNINPAADSLGTAATASSRAKKASPVLLRDAIRRVVCWSKTG